ncbi:MAG: hypothetical protein GX409_10020 [candidate division Zixibacteria bacterium]|jgi:YHS domain-containing protein|nr:hypothetical protein [candidate division Zixibacteria bacterium]
MLKKTIAIALTAFVFMVGFATIAMADEKTDQTPPSTTTPQKVVKPIKETAAESDAPAKVKATPAKLKAVQAEIAETPEGMPAHPSIFKPAANMLAVCSCGMLIKPSDTTKYFSYGDKKYALCSDYCLQNAQKDPAAAVKAIESNMAKLMNPQPTK